jgi:hypothetical protein
MSWIPFTERCKNTVNGRPCGGWWAVWNRPKGCPKCSGDPKSASPSSLTAQPAGTLFLGVPGGAIACRIPFRLEDDAIHVRFMPGIRGFVDVASQSKSVGPGGAFMRHDVTGLAGQPASGRELRQHLGGRPGHALDCQAFLFRDGDFGLGVQVEHARTKDHHEARAILAVTASVASLESAAASMLSAPAEFAVGSAAQMVDSARASDRGSIAGCDSIEQRLSAALGALLSQEIARHDAAALGRARPADSVLRSETIERIRGELAKLGLSLKSADDLILDIPHLEAVGAARGELGAAAAQVDLKAEWSELELRAAGIVMQGEMAAKRLNADSAVASEDVDNRLRELGKLVRERTTSDQAHAYRTEHAFLEMIRQAEHKVQLDGLLRESEIGQLHRKLQNGAVFDQAAADLQLRELVRGHEVGEAKHAIMIQDLKAAAERALEHARREADRNSQAADVRVRVESERVEWIAAIERTERQWKAEFGKLKDMRSLEKEEEEEAHARVLKSKLTDAEIKAADEDRATRNRIAELDAEARAEVERIKAMSGVTPELAAIITRGTNPEVVKAIFSGKSAAEADREAHAQAERIMAEVRKETAAANVNVNRMLEMVEQSMQRMAEIAMKQAEAQAGRGGKAVNLTQNFGNPSSKDR